jgi:hypothetical protein
VAFREIALLAARVDFFVLLTIDVPLAVGTVRVSNASGSCFRTSGNGTDPPFVEEMQTALSLGPTGAR